MNETGFRKTTRSSVPIRWALLLALLLSVLPGALHANSHARAATVLQSAPSTGGLGILADGPEITTIWLASITPTQAVVYFETDQLAEGYVDYGGTQNLGRVRPRSVPTESTQHSITLPNLSPNTLYYWRGHAVNDSGEDVGTIHSFRTPLVTAIAKIVVTKKNSSAVVLTGACFDLFVDAGNGTIGAFVAGYCDRYDAVSNNGQVVFPALTAGSYVLVESRSPDGYSLARKQRLSLVAGQTLQVTVTDSRGGARVTISKLDEQNEPVPGACFVASRLSNGQLGEDVAWSCDDYDGDDGITTLGNLGIGTYWLWESLVPSGHVRDTGRQISISSGQRTLDVTFTNPTERAGDNVEFQAIDSAGGLIPGACFVLFFSDTARSACDWEDGSEDGRTFFTQLDPGEYVSMEYHAPSGYQVGKRSTFTKVDNQFKRLRFTQVAGGVTVTVKTLKGNSSSALTGACYALFKRVSSGSWPSVAFWCDYEDGANDGVTKLAGVKSGTYALVQYVTPVGYVQATDQEVIVGSSGKQVTVRTFTNGITAASLVPGMVSFIAPPALKPAPVPSPTSTPVPTKTATATATPSSTPTPVQTTVPTIEPSPTEVPNASPVANAGSDQVLTDSDGTGEEEVTLDGSGSLDPEGGELTYSWGSGAAEIATGAFATLSLPLGTSSIMLTVTDSAGATSTDVVVIVVSAAQEPEGESSTPDDVSPTPDPET